MISSSESELFGSDGRETKGSDEEGVLLWTHKGGDVERELVILRSVIAAMASGPELKDVVQKVAETMTGVAGSDVCFVHIVDSERDCIVLTGATPPFDALAGLIELKIGEGVSGWVAKHGELAVVDDKWSDPRYKYIPALQGEKYSSLISVPLVSRSGGIVGVLNIHSKTRRSWNEGDIALLQRVSNLLAGTVENAMLLDRLALRERSLEAFARYIIEAQEAERRRVARELHDGLGQKLLSALFHLEAAKNSERLGTMGAKGESALVKQSDLGIQSGEVLAEIERARELLQEGIEDARRAIVDLRPGVLDDLGLSPAIEGLCRELGDIEVEYMLDEVRLNPSKEVALYRIAQEALHNVIQHSRASKARVTLDASGSVVMMSISDNGKGFDQSRGASGAHFGLEGIKERCELLGGRLEIRSSPGRGCEVRVEIPLSDEGV
jgi:signal transduction histidine kinase